MISVDGGSVLYHYYGKGKPGIPIIFLHGGPGADGTCFFKQTALAETHPIVIYNQLGSSGSPFSDDITTEEQAKSLLTIEHFVDEVQTVVDYFGFDEFIICGHNASPEARPCPFKIREIYDMFYLKRTIDHQSFWEAILMMYPYIKLPDNTEIVHIRKTLR